MTDNATCKAKNGLSGFCGLCSVRKNSVCEFLDPEEMNEVSSTMAHLPVKEGETVVAEGEVSENLYVIVSGTFRLVRLMDDGRRQVIGFAFPGDYLGSPDKIEMSYSAESLEPGLICRFPHGYLTEKSERHTEIKDRLISNGQMELRKAQDHIVLLGKATAEERVIEFLKSIANRANHNLSEEFYLPMSRQDIADYLGLRMETLSRTLTALRKNGILTAVSGRLIKFAQNEEKITA